MKKRYLNNKGGAEFSLIAAIVLTGAADLLLLSAICAGYFDSGETGKRGCYDEVMEAIRLEQEEEALNVTADPTLAGTGWTSPDGEYFFAPEDNGYYYMNGKTENYIRGSASVKYIKKEELYGTEGEVVLMDTPGAQYFRIDVLVSEELYFGSMRGNYSYVLYLSRDGDEAYIYDSGWGESTSAKIVDYPLQALLDDHFDREAEEYENSLWVNGDPSIFAKEDVDFNIAENTKEVWNAVEIGGSVIYKKEDAGVTSLYISDNGLSGSSRLLYAPVDGSDVTVFGTDGKDLYIGVGSVYDGGYETSELLRMDMADGSLSSLVKDKVQDFCIADGDIYYTDYESLTRLDKDGSSTVLWDYAVYSYEVAGGMLFIFDGDAWEILDAETGEDFGYITSGNNYTYECDICKHTEDYLYFVAYDYNRESIALHALNIWTGDERIVGDEYAGKMSDTYNVLFKDSFCYFTADNGETLVCVDVSTGEVSEAPLAGAGLWYATEMMQLCGRCVMYACDNEGVFSYVSFDEKLDMKEITGLKQR